MFNSKTRFVKFRFDKMRIDVRYDIMYKKQDGTTDV